MKTSMKQESSTKDTTALFIHGLWGFYFKTTDFQHTLMVAPSTNTGLFAVTDGLSEFPGIESETIGSVRWIGHIKVPMSATYQFTTSEAKHTIIQINGQTVQGNGSEPIRISMNQNDVCNILIEYQMAATITPFTVHDLLLYWQIDGRDKVLIPFQYLYQPDLSAKIGDDRFINAYPAVSLFGTKAIDQDSDGDKISDKLEQNGYTVDPTTFKIVEWKDEYASKGWPKYISNPFQAHTAGDPYSDSEKVLTRLPSSDRVARDPFVAAFPAVGVIMEKIIISRNTDLTDSKDYTTSTSKSWSVSGGASFNAGISPEGPSGGISVNFSGTYTTSSTITNSTGSNVHINTAETAYVNANIRYYNNGNSSIYVVTPTTSIVVDDSTITTVKAQPNEISDKLGYGEYYPDKTQHAIALNTMDQFSSRPIPLNYEQFTAINDNHKPVFLETDQVDGDLAKFSFDGTIEFLSWIPYLATMDERTARIVIDDEEEQKEQRIAGKDLDDIYDTTPEITLKQALIKAFDVTENTTDGTLSYNGKDITETSVTIIYDEVTLDFMNKQMATSKDYNIYNIILQPKMQFLIIIPDLLDYVVENDDLFGIDKQFKITDGGLNNTLAYYNEGGGAGLYFNKKSIGKLRENTRYLLSGYLRVEQGNLEVPIHINLTYKSDAVISQDITFNSNFNKFQLPFDVYEPTDFNSIFFGYDGTGDSHFYLDNISCSPLGGEFYGDNNVINPQFENNFSQWKYSGGKSEIIKEKGPNKESVLHCQIKQGEQFNLTQLIKVKKATTYVYCFDINVHLTPNELESQVYYGDTIHTQKNLAYLSDIGTIDKWHTVYNVFNTGDTDQIYIELESSKADTPIEFMATNFKLSEANPPKK